MPKTLFIDSTPDIDSVWKRVHRPSDIAISVNMGPVAAADIPRLVEGYDTVINDATYFNEETLKRCPGLKHIVFLGTGAASFVDLAAAKRLGMKVSTIGGYGDTTVAEHAMGLVFAAARHIATMHGLVRDGGWRPIQGLELRGKTLGVIGLGGIGREVARIGVGIGMQVIGWNRTPRPDVAVPQVEIEELLARSDVISLTLLLNDETRGFLDPARVALIKPGAILVNTARGALIDEAALIDALTSGQISRAGLDVFHAEPLKPDHPLTKLDNVTLTPHAAFRTPEASENLIRRALDIVRQVQGLPAVW